MGSKALQEEVDGVPFFKFLGLEIINNDGQTTLCTMPANERHIGNPYFKNIHGGIIASFLEASASIAVFDKPEEGAPKPINLTISYLRPAKMKSLNCRATIVRSGRRIAVVEAVAWQDEEEKPVAKGQFQFLLV